MKMSILDAAILGDLFNRKYMDFETCCNLRLVSRKFDFHALKYFKSLTKFDFGILPDNSKKDSDFDDLDYSSLFGTVTEYCVNLRQLKNVDHRFCKNSFARLVKLTKLTRVEFRSFFYACPDSSAVLKQLPNLHSVVLDFIHVACDDDEPPDSASDDERMDTESSEESSETDDEVCTTPELNLSENEKLHVEELSIGCDKFWNIFCLASLKKLTISLHFFFNDEFRVRKLNSLLPLCQNLEALEASISADRAAALFPPLSRNTESLPRFEKLAVNLNGSREQVEELISKCPQIIQHVTKLESWDLMSKGIFAQFRPNRNISMPKNFRC